MGKLDALSPFDLDYNASVKSYIKDDLIRMSGADIYIEVEANPNYSDEGNSVTIIMSNASLTLVMEIRINSFSSNAALVDFPWGVKGMGMRVGCVGTESCPDAYPDNAHNRMIEIQFIFMRFICQIF